MLQVEVGPGDDRVHVVHGVVVGVDRAPQIRLVRQRAPAAQAEVARGAHGGVEEVVRIGDAVAVAVPPQRLPGGRDELHRPDRTVPHRVAVEATAVGVVDGAGVGCAVEHRAEDGRGDIAGRAEAGLGAEVPAVVGLDPADAGQHAPRQLAARVEARGPGLRVAVRAQRHFGDLVVGGGGRGDRWRRRGGSGTGGGLLRGGRGGRGVGTGGTTPQPGLVAGGGLVLGAHAEPVAERAAAALAGDQARQRRQGGERHQRPQGPCLVAAERETGEAEPAVGAGDLRLWKADLEVWRTWHEDLRYGGSLPWEHTTADTNTPAATDRVLPASAVEPSPGPSGAKPQRPARVSLFASLCHSLGAARQTSLRGRRRRTTPP